MAKSTRSCKTAPASAMHAAVGGQQAVAAIAQHDAAKAGVGNDQVGAAADHHGFHAARARDTEGGDERLDAAGFGIEVGGTADAEARIAGERGAFGNG